MYIGEVMGSVVATQKTENMNGLPLRLVRKVNVDTSVTDSFVVAVDVIGAAVGELVLVTSGSPARQTRATDNRPVDAILIAVVETWQIQNDVQYTRSSG
ncbi:MAG: ethanolamine utilization protein EutN [Anaerolineaceae bacterium]|nr:ethanolamine utilization protein EutN [Anaerolineaceae bacterium]